jgi:hypothetical protein
MVAISPLQIRFLLPSVKNEGPPGKVVVARCIRWPGGGLPLLHLVFAVAVFTVRMCGQSWGKGGLGLPFFGSDGAGGQAKSKRSGGELPRDVRTTSKGEE